MLIHGRRIDRVHSTALRDVMDARSIDVGGHTAIPGLVEGYAYLPFAYQADIAGTDDLPPRNKRCSRCRMGARCSTPAALPA